MTFFAINDLFDLLKIFLAMLLGGILGVDREFSEKPAGLRTHMLVAGASATLVVLCRHLLVELNSSGISDAIQADPIRIFEVIVTGVAFIGAGTIIRDRAGSVSGLTTAASLLMAAVIGISVGFQKFAIAIGIPVLTVTTMRVGKLFEKKFVERIKKERVSQ